MKLQKLILTLMSLVVLAGIFSCASEAFNAPTPTGVGGSMAKFTVVDDYLFVIDEKNLKVFDISNAATPIYAKDIEVGYGIETVFPYQGKLFIGAEDGMHIYDISNPLMPVFISTYSHIQSCDPVVVQDTIAYITLRNNSTCRFDNSLNQLEIISIAKHESPVLLNTYSLNEPYGLGVDDTLLFVCDGKFGLLVLNIKDVFDPKIITRISGIETYDVIPYQKRLLVSGRTGIHQYNYLSPDSIYLISSIPVNN